MESSAVSSVYVAGLFLGRLLASYVIVLLLAWLFKRGQFRQALAFTKRPLGWLAVLAVFFLGLLGSVLSAARSMA